MGKFIFFYSLGHFSAHREDPLGIKPVLPNLCKSVYLFTHTPPFADLDLKNFLNYFQ